MRPINLGMAEKIIAAKGYGKIVVERDGQRFIARAEKVKDGRTLAATSLRGTFEAAVSALVESITR